MTTRGFGAAEAEKVANLIADVLEAPNDETALARVKREVGALCQRFPVYPRPPSPPGRRRRAEMQRDPAAAPPDEMSVLQG